jgi:hypothetical protein
MYNEKIQAAIKLLNGYLIPFMSSRQRQTLKVLMGLEEGEALADLVINAYNQIAATPKTYETEGVQDKIVHLHYFVGNVDAWIIERDVGDKPESDGVGVQHQAFGYQSFYGIEEAEMGYISLPELFKVYAELDLHFEPITFKELKERA